MQNRILIIDFGGQYNQLIARRVRECGVYSEVKGFENITLDDVKAFDPKGIIFTGGPQSAYGDGAPSIDSGIFELGIPILGICYGMQFMAYKLGGKVSTAPTSEYGRTEVTVDNKDGVLRNADDTTVVWMSHTDYVSETPEGFTVTCHTKDCPIAGMENIEKGMYAVQFHPEVNHTLQGFDMIRSFVLDACKCDQDWQMAAFAEEEAKKIGKVDYLVQGTIYPDVIESGLGKSAVIKSHHNVGGLPDYVDFKEIIEPLRSLFKDEVRKTGLELGIPEYLVYRQPFPGPGLGIRIIGEVNAEKVRIVQDADYIYREEVAKAVAAGEMTAPNQYFAALTNMRSVGVMGDFRTYDYAVALRAVETSDFMTAEAVDIPWKVLQTCMTRIINEVDGVNRVFYDLTSKPPGTIEFE